ncbi:MAG: hypothetical protein KDJ29_09840 [Hyphomicrobiales bacterium]|nr:hypothetical protein [Hyphomicrobiales bacterium]
MTVWKQCVATREVSPEPLEQCVACRTSYEEYLLYLLGEEGVPELVELIALAPVQTRKLLRSVIYSIVDNLQNSNV